MGTRRSWTLLASDIRPHHKGASFVLQPKRYKDVDLESDGFTVAAKATRGADTSE